MGGLDKETMWSSGAKINLYLSASCNVFSQVSAVCFHRAFSRARLEGSRIRQRRLSWLAYLKPLSRCHQPFGRRHEEVQWSCLGFVLLHCSIYQHGSCALLPVSCASR